MYYEYAIYLRDISFSSVNIYEALVPNPVPDISLHKK